MGELLTPVVLNWSGGKDSAFALYQLLQNPKYVVKYLQTTLSAEHQRISMHGVRRELLMEQANQIGIPLREIFLPGSAGMSAYNEIMRQACKKQLIEGITHTAFGDLFLEDLRKYRTEQLASCGITALFPIWGRSTHEMARDFLNSGFQTIIVATDNSRLPASFCGRMFDEAFLQNLPDDVDPCGENGEFHTFCFDGPIFRNRVKFTVGDRVKKSYTHDGKEYGFTFCDLI